MHGPQINKSLSSCQSWSPYMRWVVAALQNLFHLSNLQPCNNKTSQRTDPNAQLLVQANQATLSGYKDYKVGPEDLLGVDFFGQDDLNREVRVNGQGEISLPLIGGVSVNGLSPQEIEARLVQAYKEGKFIRNPQISVSVKEYRHQRVMVTGAVANPGSYEVIGPRTLLEMLGKAGGIVDKPEMKAGDLVYVARAQNAPALMKPAKGTTSKPSVPDKHRDRLAPLIIRTARWN